MRLHEFIEREQRGILRCAVSKLKELWPNRTEADLEVGLAPVLDEIKRALQREAGLPVASPLPGSSECAARIGEQRLLLGFSIADVPRAIGALSDATGALGKKARLSFDAADYQMFNLCIDTSIASAIDRYWHESQAFREHETTARIGTIAHELRNALASACMAFAMLRTGQMGIASRTGDVLERSLGRMRALVERTLLAVRLETRAAEHNVRIDVVRLVHEIVAETVLERGVSIRADVVAGAVWICNERVLASAISNLLQNAVKFTRDGGQVEVRGTVSPAGLDIEIEDECGGLPPGVERDMFEQFTQHSHDRRGLGLGLAITKEAVEACGGTISVRDLPGKGCVFTIQLRTPRVIGERE
jgi:signal transduction histidine kinase